MNTSLVKQLILTEQGMNDLLVIAHHGVVFWSSAVGICLEYEGARVHLFAIDNQHLKIPVEQNLHQCPREMCQIMRVRISTISYHLKKKQKNDE